MLNARHRGTPKNQKLGRAGFTMLELLVATAIIGIVVPSLAIGLRSLIVLNNRSRDLALVSTVAENKVEEIRSSGFNSLSTGTIDFSDELPPKLASPKSASYTVTNPDSGIIELVIDISYWDYSKEKTLSYKTVISELGVGQ